MTRIQTKPYRKSTTTTTTPSDNTPISSTTSKMATRRHKPWKHFSHTLIYLLLGTTCVARAQCPWPREVVELNGSCLCAYNLQNELSIQCTSVNFTLLMTVLHQRAASVPLDLLYVNGTRISALNDRTFDGLSVENIQFSSCGIYNISEGAFRGLEDKLKNLNLQDNRISQVPTEALTRLRRLKLLDLSGNLLTNIPRDAFNGLRLSTLKLAENNLVLADGAFAGLESTLKNLNLKDTQQKAIPRAIVNLPVLAFLDIAQNEIRSLEKGVLRNLHSLTALNVERNLLQSLAPEDFTGINDTLSSLSLLNNLITRFPARAFSTLSELRVLDVGFNLIPEIPVEGFRGVKSLTLLALDGNPLSTVPEAAFGHLTSSLRGLSVGGRFLNCDCRMAWIPRWITEYDLQVTSRERDPQFCGQPPDHRDRSFYQLNEAEMTCDDPSPASSFTSTRPPPPPPPPPPSVLQPKATTAATPASPSSTSPSALPTRTPITTTTTATTTTDATTTTTTATTEKPQMTSFRPGEVILPGSSSVGHGHVGSVQRGPGGEAPRRGGGRRPGTGNDLPPPPPPPRSQQRPPHTVLERPASQPVPSSPPSSSSPSRPSLVLRNNEREDNEDRFFGQASGPFVEEVIVQDAYRKENSVIIQWDSEVSNILGFRVVYRLFGDKNFKLGPPLAASEREFKIKNVPTQECIVVCVVSLEDTNVTPDSVQNSQCREIRTETTAAMHMDTIIIAASAAICGTVIIAVVVFICCNRKRGSSSKEKHGIPSVLSASSSPPLASLGTLGAGVGGGVGGGKADWDTLSMYSQRSIPRARMYHMDKGSINNGFVPEDARSHFSHASSRHIPRARSMADGQSQRSYSALSAANLRHAPSFTGLGLSRPDLSLSRQSLATTHFSGAGFGPMAVNPNAAYGLGGPGSTVGMPRAPSQRGGDRRRHRSKSRERSSSRLSHAGSQHSLTGYDTDGWTDHDMDIYVARNPTRGGLVQL
ncbi:leucine-rich repeat and fibronectin type III domain-containing protein 1-like protein [Eriocheir sinensis]|uniref:leucine-rich repeat and fibronectin type III domain-containing protein 1-like protein n=1 Tax=Eriocheir sinensis TaxID=95602 RepID=UPI0021CA1A95|nr:leucine-rich repeat and fibronectin type III domain-containing protein 1-like protein [Eriocheir sinensis]